MADFDKTKCQQRNRIAAKRDDVDASPLSMLPSNSGMAMPIDEALACINSHRATDTPELTADDVYIHYAEAANDNFIGDRFMFLDADTLRNMATDAESGVAFMNSHRTGGLSSPAELPFGRTFMGRYEDGGDSKRCVLGVYMLKGVYPNGQSGPSTDDLHRMIDAGTLFDVSVGLSQGRYVCDVCGVNLDTDECAHVPGTTEGMDDEQIAAQLARGVPRGCASYSICDARLSEVSAVFDGAVPGAGFRKFLSRARQGLSTRATVQGQHAYAKLLQEGDIDMGEDIITAIKEGFASLGERLGMRAPAVVEQDETATAEPEMLLTEANEQLVAQKAELDAAQAHAVELEMERAAAELALRESAVDARLATMAAEGRVTPAMKPALRALLLADHSEDAETLLSALPVSIEFGERGFDVPASEAIPFNSLNAFCGAPADERTKAVQTYMTAHNLNSFSAADAALRAELARGGK